MRRGGDAAAAVVMMGVSGAGKSTLALKKAYRRQIIDDHSDVRLVFLEGSRELITERLAEPPGLEENPITIGINRPTEGVIGRIVHTLGSVAQPARWARSNLGDKG